MRPGKWIVKVWGRYGLSLEKVWLRFSPASERWRGEGGFLLQIQQQVLSWISGYPQNITSRLVYNIQRYMMYTRWIYGSKHMWIGFAKWVTSPFYSQISTYVRFKRYISKDSGSMIFISMFANTIKIWNNNQL